MILAEEVKRIGQQRNLNLPGVMLHLLDEAKQRAVVPISHFKVGAVAAGPVVDGWANLYLGANMEFETLPLAFSIHAEQAAVNELWLSGEAEMSALACTSPPCGLCRQFLMEVGSDFDILTPDGRFTLSELLPHAFGPADLGQKGGLLLPRFQPLQFREDVPGDALMRAALDAASRSYAPYTLASVGCAVEATDGAVITGRYAESVAFNPSLTALQSAFSRSAGREIKRIALVTHIMSRYPEIAVADLLRSVHAEVATMEIRTAVRAR